MSQPYLGEMRMFGFNFAPKGYALANGQLLSLQQNQALFSLFGTTYGGDGQTTFALPHLQGGVPIHRGAGFVQGEAGGEAAVALNQTQIPAHNHSFLVAKGSATSEDPTGLAPARTNAEIYGAPGISSFDPISTTAVGGSQAHNNMPPYLVINWCVALTGVFPTRS